MHVTVESDSDPAEPESTETHEAGRDAPEVAARAVDRDPYRSGTQLSSDQNRTDRGSRGAVWWAIAVAGVGLAIITRVIVAQSAVAPRTPWDEISILQLARMFSGIDEIPPLGGRGYNPGFAIILAPVWWFTTDPQAVYSSAIVINSIIGVLTIWPLVAIARRLGLSLPQAITAGAIIMCLPSRTALADYTLSEQSFFFFLAWSTAAAFWLWHKPTVLRGTGFALLVVATLLMHARGLAVVLAAAVWLVLCCRRRLGPALVGLLVLIVSFFVARWFMGATSDAILLDESTRSERFFDNLRDTWASLALRVTTSHLWAQLVASFGLVAIGAVALLTWTWREMRELRQVGPVGFIFGVAGAGIAVSIIYWVSPVEMLGEDNRRLDVWLYTRYIDPYAGLILMVGLALLFRIAERRLLLIATAAAGAGALVMIFLTAPIIPTWGSNYGPGNAAGVQMWSETWPEDEFGLPLVPSFTNENRFFVWASLTFLVVLLMVIVLRRYRRALAVILLAVATTGAIIGNPEQRRDTPDNLLAAIESAEQLSGTPESLDIDVECEISGSDRAVALNWMAYWLSPREVDVVRPSSQDFAADLVLACREWDLAEQLDARAIDGGGKYGHQLYVLPGELQSQLAEAGALDGE